MKLIRKTLVLFLSLILIVASAGMVMAADMKAGMVTDVGGINDQSFNQSAWGGMQKASEELGVEVVYLESNQESDYAPNLETLYDQENDLIWGIGFMMGDKVLEAAQINPEQKYACIDMFYENPPENLVGVNFKEQECSFLVGYIAGKMTNAGKVGFVGGMDFDVIHRFQYGFMGGVKTANPDCEILVQYAGAFDDVTKGKSIANQMYQKGADIVFHAAGFTGTGVIEAAKENDKYVIGVDMDQNFLAPEHVITSAVKRVDNGIFNVIRDLDEGRFPGGTNVVYGLAEGGVDIAETSDKHVPRTVLDEVADLKARIIEGEVRVPANQSEYGEFF